MTVPSILRRAMAAISVALESPAIEGRLEPSPIYAVFVVIVEWSLFLVRVWLSSCIEVAFKLV